MEQKVKRIMADVLDLDSQTSDGPSTIDTIESWDSLTHINLCLSVEQDFQIASTVAEIEAMLFYSDILLVLREKV